MGEVFGYVKPPLEELRDLLPGTDGFDFGTSPHGLSAGLPLPVQETPEASSLSLHAKPLLTSPEPSAEPVGKPAGGAQATPAEGGSFPRAEPSTDRAAEGAHPWRNKPNVYTSAKAACRCLRLAAAELSAKPPYYLRLSDREFLQVYEAVEHDRNRTRKAIGKGLAEHGDLRASDPLWQILQDVMTRRMKGYRL